ncbi:MAG: hypothetical protein M1815_004822 [Lichina confinis]|nr:MAG: hypothetical protein M1815_004822 [Lichina confinis]
MSPSNPEWDGVVHGSTSPTHRPRSYQLKVVKGAPAAVPANWGAGVPADDDRPHRDPVSLAPDTPMPVPIRDD